MQERIMGLVISMMDIGSVGQSRIEKDSTTASVD